MRVHAHYVYYDNILEDSGILGLMSETIEEEIDNHLSPYLRYLWRKGQSDHFKTIVTGLILDQSGRRKTLQDINFAFNDSKGLRNLYHFMRDAKFDDEGMRLEHQRQVAALLSRPTGMITGDASEIAKKGKHSVGVAHGYCGSRGGGTANCQDGVFLGYVSDQGHALVDYNLYIPEKWFDDEHEELRKKCLMPDNITFMTKNAILSTMIRRLWDSRAFDAKYLGVDSSFGRDHEFLDSLPQELIYFADIPQNHLVFLGSPVMAVPEYAGVGRKPFVPVPSFPPVSVDSIANDDSIPWREAVLGTGTKGPIIANDKCVQVVEARKGQPGKNVWLYIRRLEDGSLKYALCNESEDASLEDIRMPALLRWSIEQSFKECKSYLGMDHYETRSWVGWRRHMLMVFIAQLFLLKVIHKFHLKKTIPLSAPTVVKPVPMEEYIDALHKLQNNQDVHNPNIIVEAVVTSMYLTFSLAQKLATKFLIIKGNIFRYMKKVLRNNASSYDSYARQTNASLLYRFKEVES